MLLLTPIDKISYNSYFNFTSKMLSAMEIININQTSNNLFTYPNQNCRKSLCISLVNADLSYQVNITSILVKSTNSYNFNCIYAGLVSGEMFVSGFLESNTTICESSSDIKPMSFYSRNSSLILVLYWYKRYSEINVSLMISQTKCKTALINLCVLELLCEITKIRCQSYINNMTRFSGINLTANHFTFILPNNNIGECLVLQITSIPQDFKDLYRLMLVKEDNIYFDIYSICYFNFYVTYDKIVQIRQSDNRKEFKIYDNTLHYSSTESLFKNKSEPRMPRAILRNKELSSGTVLPGTGYLSVALKDPPTNSWVEVEIHSTARDSSPDIRGFAVDFIFNNDSKSITYDFGNLGYGILVLKSNSKAIDPNASLEMEVFFPIYSPMPIDDRTDDSYGE